MRGRADFHQRFFGETEWCIQTAICASNPEWVELFERTRRQMIEGAGQRIFPEVTDPPLFHLYADELEDAVTRLMDMVGEQMRHSRSRGV